MSSSTRSTQRRPAHRIAYITTAFPWRSETAAVPADQRWLARWHPCHTQGGHGSGQTHDLHLVSGIPELIQDGVEGRLVQQENPQALCQAIRDLLDDPQQCARRGRAGRDKIEREFNIAVSARELATLIEDVLSEDTRP